MFPSEVEPELDEGVVDRVERLLESWEDELDGEFVLAPVLDTDGVDGLPPFAAGTPADRRLVAPSSLMRRLGASGLVAVRMVELPWYLSRASAGVTILGSGRAPISLPAVGKRRSFGETPLYDGFRLLFVRPADELWGRAVRGSTPVPTRLGGSLFGLADEEFWDVGIELRLAESGVGES